MPASPNGCSSAKLTASTGFAVYSYLIHSWVVVMNETSPSTVPAVTFAA